MESSFLSPYYKTIVTSLVLSLCLNIAVYAKKNDVSQLLRCLAQEELVFHQKKITGPLYTLNQLFINDVASFGGAKLRKTYQQQICSNSMKVSSEFLKVLVLKGKNAFIEDKSDTNLFKKASLQSMLERAPHIFFSYISNVQGLFASARCLEKELPEIPHYIDRFKYLQNDLKPQELLNDRKKVRRIFDKLENLEPLIKRCQDEFDQEMKKNKKS